MPGLSRRHWLIGANALWITTAKAATLPLADALPKALHAALREGQPLVVMASLESCPFCKIVRDQHLAPMHAREGLHVVQIDLRSAHALTDFHEKATTHDNWLRAMGVRIAPTLLFLGMNGAEVAPRMEGAVIPDFFASYLSDRLTLARSRTGSKPAT